MGGCKQFTSCKRSRRNLLGKLESYQRGFNWNIPFKCRLKPWFDFFQRISEEWKSRQILIFWGVDAQEIPGGTPEAWSRPSVLSGFLLHDLVTGGIPHAGPRQGAIAFSTNRTDWVIFIDHAVWMSFTCCEIKIWATWYVLSDSAMLSPETDWAYVRRHGHH